MKQKSAEFLLYKIWQLLRGGDSSGGGDSVYLDLSADNTGVPIKAAAGQVNGWVITNTHTTYAYVKLYDKATAPDNSDTPLLVFGIPGGTNGVAANVGFGSPIQFASGIGIRVTANSGNADNTAPGADVVVNILYK